MADILTKYNIVFTYSPVSGNLGVTSDEPLLTTFLQRINTLYSVIKLYSQVRHFLEFDKQETLELPLSGTKRVLLTKLHATLWGDEADDKQPFMLPSIDMQDILYHWLLYIQPFKTRKVEISQGESIIGIINDRFINALVIEKAVAAHWPDCGGSVGEYYSVSVNDYEKQRELTVDLNEALISGTDVEVLDEIANFLNLFDNGVYSVAISEIDLADSEIARDGMLTYGVHIEDDKKFTYWTYPSSDEMYLFTRSVNTIDKERVAYYADMIAAGAWPKVVVYSVFDNYKGDHTARYIIDGHHKLMAYEQLRINIPAVFINSDSSTQPQKNIAPQLLGLLKPVEMMHVLENNDNTADIDVYKNPGITYYLDRILKEEKSLSITLMTVLYEAYHSDHASKEWAEARLAVLSQNKYQGKGQRLYYKTFDPAYNHKLFMPVFIEDINDFNTWKNVFLNSVEMPIEILDRQKALSERYYPSYYPPQNTHTSLETYGRYNSAYTNKETKPWRTIISAILVFLYLLMLLKACN